MSEYIKGLDNVAIICHADKDNFSKMEKMGFQLYPLGRQGIKIGKWYLKGGTGSIAAHFKNGGYLELISIYNPFLITGGYKKILKEKNERFIKFAVEVSDAKAEVARLKKEGKKAFGPMVFRRVFTSKTKGKQDARFSIMVYPNPMDYPISVSGTQHLTPEVTWQDDLLDHPNGTRLLSNVLVVTEKAEETVKQYEGYFDQPFEKNGDEYRCQLENQSRITFISKADLKKEYPEINVDTEPFIAAAYFGVEDLDVVKNLFENNEVPFTEKNRQLIVPKDYVFDSMFIFEEAERESNRNSR